MVKTQTVYPDALTWLLEPEDVGVRYLALRDLEKTSQKALWAAKREAHAHGPIAAVLAKMNREGYWVQPGAGYYPKYTGSVWSVILLAQLGASVEADDRVQAACSYMLDHALAPQGQFTVNGAPSGTCDCLQGNLCMAMQDLGVQDARLDKAFEWMARSVTGEGIAPLQDKSAPIRYYAGKCGPRFACGANNKLPCAWGAAKVMLAFGRLPKKKWTPLIRCAIEDGVAFLFSTDPAKADYPCGWAQKPSQNWWKFGFPVFYVTDFLQIVEALARLEFGRDERLAPALTLIANKQDTQGRWALEYDYTGKTWCDFGRKKQPNKWVTLRAQRVQKLARER